MTNELSRPRRTGRLFAMPVALAALLTGEISFSAGEKPVASPTEAVGQLELGKPVKQVLAGGQSHSYRIRLDAGQFLEVFVEQQGIDVLTTLTGPDGTKLFESDSPNVSFGRRFAARGGVAGEHLLRGESPLRGSSGEL